MSTWQVQLVGKDGTTYVLVSSRKAGLDMADLHPERRVSIRPLPEFKLLVKCPEGICKGVCRCACLRKEGIVAEHKSICTHAKAARA